MSSACEAAVDFVGVWRLRPKDGLHLRVAHGGSSSLWVLRFRFIDPLGSDDVWEAVAELSWVERCRMQCGGLPSSYLMAHGASSVAKDLGEKAGSAEGLSLWLICCDQHKIAGVNR